MAKGISLHIGLNKVDSSHYRGASVNVGWEGVLKGCENDATAMEAIAKTNKFDTDILLTANATRANVMDKISRASKDLVSGDYFFLTYSGHGSQVADISGDEMLDKDLPSKKRDRRDETWCLFDAQFIDDELFGLLASFKKEVRIVIFSDSCHSGTVAKEVGDVLPTPEPGRAFRVVPKATLSNTYFHHRSFYDGLQRPKGVQPEIDARVILISGCQDDELSQEDQLSMPPHGFFTLGLMDAFDLGTATSYQKLFDEVSQAMPSKQNPNLLEFGGHDPGLISTKPLFIG